ncbi:MAG: hypothetical protein OCC45_05225 [Desulfotalea sp.]
MQENLPSFVEFLQSPEFYPHEVESVQLLQTHISYVFVGGQYAYKFKKDVNFGFLDFSTLEKRKYFCQQEIELNRRLCPDLYLKMVALVIKDGKLQLSEQLEEDAVEYGVKMARMDQTKQMNTLLSENLVGEKDLDAIVAKLVPFYKNAKISDEIAEFGTAEKFGVNVLENFEQTEGFVGGEALSEECFSQIKEYSLSFLRNEKVFAERIDAGRIRDCHGDLYSANICLQDDVQIFDCIEFNERFRYSDVAADIAFLAMDLDYHGRSDLGQYFVEKYVAESNDKSLLNVLVFYKVYRAYVRAKIALFTASDPAVSADVATNCKKDAAKYFALALGYVRA